MNLRLIFCLIALIFSDVSRAQMTPLTVVDLEFTDDSYGQYQSFASEAAKAVGQIINSNEFRDRLLNLRMTKKEGLTNLEIYNLLKDGKEKKCPERVSYTDIEGSDCPKKTINIDTPCLEGDPRVINLKVRTLNICDGDKWINKNCKIGSWANTIGIDGSGDGVTAICPQRLELWNNGNEIALLAGHYTHEYMHILGFSHTWYKKRKSAVYKIGHLVRDMIKEQVTTSP